MFYAGLSWSCSTIRSRLRVVSSSMAAVAKPLMPTDGAPSSADSIQEQPARTAEQDESTPKPRAANLDDYFGDVDMVTSEGAEPLAPTERGDRDLETVVDSWISPDDRLALESTAHEESRPSFDWTKIPLDTPHLPDHIRFARSIDWASTSLGPIEDWSADLRSMSNMVMGSPHPAALYWGADYIAIYNEAYISIAGQKHPRLMGARYKDAWADIWSEIEPFVESAWHSGQATMKHDDCLFTTRNGFVEEAFFNWSIVPLIGPDGNVVALTTRHSRTPAGK